jgi:hypothetical protein
MQDIVAVIAVQGVITVVDEHIEPLAIAEEFIRATVTVDRIVAAQAFDFIGKAIIGGRIGIVA